MSRVYFSSPYVVQRFERGQDLGPRGSGDLPYPGFRSVRRQSSPFYSPTTCPVLVYVGVSPSPLLGSLSPRSFLPVDMV